MEALKIIPFYSSIIIIISSIVFFLESSAISKPVKKESGEVLVLVRYSAIFSTYVFDNSNDMLLAVFPLSPLCTVVSIFAISRAQKETRRSAILRYKFAERQWNIRRDNDAVGGVWEISPGSQTIVVVVIVAGNLRHCQRGVTHYHFALSLSPAADAIGAKK